MSSIYHWTGFAVIWLTILAIGIVVGFIACKAFYEYVWFRTWVFKTFDVIRIYFCYCRKPYTKCVLNGEVLWGMEGKLIRGKRHLYKKWLLNYAYPRILELNPETKKMYDEFNQLQKGLREDHLKAKGWQSHRVHEGMELSWLHLNISPTNYVKDFVMKGLDVWKAYNLQDKWDEEEKKKKESERKKRFVEEAQ